MNIIWCVRGDKNLLLKFNVDTKDSVKIVTGILEAIGMQYEKREKGQSIEDRFLWNYYEIFYNCSIMGKSSIGVIFYCSPFPFIYEF